MEFPEETELCKLAYKYGSDKCPRVRHSYTPYYYSIWNSQRKSIKKILEIGIGHYKGMKINKTTYDPRLKVIYHRGASLYMWRDFFSNALVYGADIHPETIFQDEGIKTFLCDQTKKEDLIKLINSTGSDIDIVIDDGSHELESQITTCQTLMPLLKKSVTYIIEDVTWTRKVVPALNKLYDCQVPQISRLGGNDQVVVVKNRV